MYNVVQCTFTLVLSITPALHAANYIENGKHHTLLLVSKHLQSLYTNYVLIQTNLSLNSKCVGENWRVCRVEELFHCVVYCMFALFIVWCRNKCKQQNVKCEWEWIYECFFFTSLYSAFLSFRSLFCVR